MAKRSANLLLVALIAAWVGILLTAGDCPAQLYRYVDKNGNVVLTDNPPPGVATEAIEKEKAPSSGTVAPKDRSPQTPSAKPAPPSKGGDQVKEDVDKVAREEADKVAEKVAKEEADKETSRIMAEEEARKQAERQRRLEEADRIEAEAKKPLQPTQENIDRQMKLMQEAQRLRDMQ